MRVQPNAAVSGGGAEPVPAEADLEGGRSSSSCDASARSWWARARKLRAESAWEGCLPNLGPTDDRFPAIAPGRIGWHGRYTDAVADEEYVRTELCPLLERRIFFISLLLAALAFLAALTSDLSFGAASPGSVSGVLPPTRAHGLARLFYALEIPCFLALAAVAYAARRRHIHPSTPALARLAAGTLLLTFTLNVLSSSMHMRIAMAEANGTEFSARELELIMQTESSLGAKLLWLLYNQLLVAVAMPFEPLEHVAFTALSLLVVWLETSLAMPAALSGEDATVLTVFSIHSLLLLMGAVTISLARRAAWHYVCAAIRHFEERRSEEARARQLELADSAEEAARAERGKLLRVVMHDLRSPLLSIINISSGLDETKATTPVGDPAVREGIDGLKTCATLMERIVSDMLDFERISGGRLVLLKQPFSLQHLLDSVRITFAGLAAAKSIALTVEPVAHGLLLVPLIGDERRLQQCLNNGLSNAIKFTETGGTITLRAASFDWLPDDDEAAERTDAADDGGELGAADAGASATASARSQVGAEAARATARFSKECAPTPPPPPRVRASSSVFSNLGAAGSRACAPASAADARSTQGGDTPPPSGARRGEASDCAGLGSSESPPPSLLSGRRAKAAAPGGRVCGAARAADGGGGVAPSTRFVPARLRVSWQLVGDLVLRSAQASGAAPRPADAAAKAVELPARGSNAVDVGGGPSSTGVSVGAPPTPPPAAGPVARPARQLRKCRATIVIEDRGVGLSESELAAINSNEAFTQVGKGQLQGNGGTGLGLTIVRHILKLHDDSTLELSSDGPGKGTRFTLQLNLQAQRLTARGKAAADRGTADLGKSPVSGAEPNAPRPLSQLTKMQFRPGFRVLYVEDDNVLRRSLQLRLLNKIGVKYELAENGKIAVDYVLKTIEENAAGIEALADAEAAADAEEDEADLAAEAAAADRAAEQLAPSRRLSAASHSSSTTARGEHFEMGPLRKRAHDLAFELVSVDLVIMDNQMPVMTGEQATRALRSAGYRGVIIGMTGDPTGSADRSEFEAAGLNRCLDKDSKAIEILHGIVRSFAIGGDNYETVSADTRGGSRNTRWIAQAEALAEIDAQQLAEAMGVPRVVCNDTAGVHSRRGSYVPGRRGSLSAARSPFPQLASTAPPPCAAPPPPPPPPPPPLVVHETDESESCRGGRTPKPSPVQAAYSALPLHPGHSARPPQSLSAAAEAAPAAGDRFSPLPHHTAVLSPPDPAKPGDEAGVGVGGDVIV